MNKKHYIFAYQGKANKFKTTQIQQSQVKE
jgi:hypothetical protein